MKRVISNLALVFLALEVSGEKTEAVEYHKRHLQTIGSLNLTNASSIDA
jgi:hypothetical protein